MIFLFFFFRITILKVFVIQYFLFSCIWFHLENKDIKTSFLFSLLFIAFCFVFYYIILYLLKLFYYIIYLRKSSRNFCNTVIRLPYYKIIHDTFFLILKYRNIEIRKSLYID